ncbi:MAG: hypothetical protein ACRCYY_00970 [Trueperaceae bacterium]
MRWFNGQTTEIYFDVSIVKQEKLEQLFETLPYFAGRTGNVFHYYNQPFEKERSLGEELCIEVIEEKFYLGQIEIKGYGLNFYFYSHEDLMQKTMKLSWNNFSNLG